MAPAPRAAAATPDETIEMLFRKENAAVQGFDRWLINGAAFSMADMAPRFQLKQGRRYRLYGVQTCLRGTTYTDHAGQRRDCGEASLAVLAAYITDTHPVCATMVGRGPGLRARMRRATS